MKTIKFLLKMVGMNLPVTLLQEIMIKMKDFYLSEIKGIKIECHSDNTCNL